jgi:2-polyprenyl-6-methoxyphenol hydroxylase-like FAD-dependent oxidoreductase
MEHYRRLGIARQLRPLGLAPDRPTDVSYFTRLTGWELARLRLPSDAEKQRGVEASAATDQIPEPDLRANQMYVEAFLLAHARTRPNITVRFGWEVDGFVDDGGGVTVEVEADPGGAPGARETWRADYLVGCDGGRSFVRRSLAIDYQGLAKHDSDRFGGRMIASHVRAPTLYRAHLAARTSWQYWVVNAEIHVPIIALRDDDEFLIFSKARGEEPPRDEDIASLVRRAVGADLPLTILAHRPWTAGAALVAERFHAGRVFLAGDAAHLFTPTGGFGMNTGVDDVSNLAWKLAATVQGWGGPELLPTYELERHPIAKRNTAAGRELTVKIAGMRAPPALEEDSAEGAAARRRLGAHLESTFLEEFASIGVHLGARYDGSPIIVPDGAPPSDDHVRYTPSSVPGGRAPHCWLDRGRGPGSSLFDRLGLGVTLLRLGGAASSAAAIEHAARARSIPFAVLDVPGADARDLYGCDLVLVRPDQHVSWRGNALPPDPDRLLAIILGADPR